MEKTEKRTIYFVEDDPLMARMYERILRLSGFEVEMAFNGEEAIAKFEKMEQKPILVLLDIMMPKLSGFDVLRYMKQKPDLKNIPVVVLTNLASKEDAERALELGAVLYLVKSEYKPKEIVAKLEEILAGYKKSEVPEVKVVTKDIDSQK